MRRRLLVPALVGVALTAAIVAVGYLAELRPERLRTRIAGALATRFNAEVTIEDLAISVLPRIRVSGGGLTLRVRNRPDLPPFIAITRFSMDLQPFSVARRHVKTVHLDGLRIQVPPSEARRTLTGWPGTGDVLHPSRVMIDRLITHDAQLAFVPTKPGHRPHVFDIQDLELAELGFDRPIPFRARLINPIPVGLIETTGTLGPWSRAAPADTPVAGRYRFSGADLSMINGLHGTLSSDGEYRGRISAIEVTGTTETPDFNLDLGGMPLPLHTRFSAVVDGTDGTTILHSVDAMLRRSTIRAKGAVVNLPGPGQHSTDLEVDVPTGRIEDLLAFVTRSPTPMATGGATLHATVHLPPGPRSKLSRLTVSGRFGLDRTVFRENVQSRVREFSRRTQGRRTEEMDPTVASNLRGAFALAGGTLRLRRLTFDVPGATVALDGTTDLRTRSIDLTGTLTMEASVSQAVGGFKSIFLKMVDPFFRHHGSTMVPIRIGGTIDAPTPSVNLRRKKS